MAFLPRAPGGRARGVQPKPRPDCQRVPRPAPLHAAGHHGRKARPGALSAAPSSLLLFQGQEYGETHRSLTSRATPTLVWWRPFGAGAKRSWSPSGWPSTTAIRKIPRPSAPAYSIRLASSRRPTPSILALTKDLLALRKRIRALSDRTARSPHRETRRSAPNPRHLARGSRRLGGARHPVLRPASRLMSATCAEHAIRPRVVHAQLRIWPRRRRRPHRRHRARHGHVALPPARAI